MTTFTRRNFNGLMLGGLAATAIPRPALTAEPDILVAMPGSVQLAPPEYPETKVWAYGGVVPGAGLRVPQGTRVRREFVNNLPQPSTVHWHGIRIANAMDGVVGMTQDAVEPGDRFLYEFDLPDAGTYWYHPHNRTWEQMARGLYAPLIVEEPEGAPDVELDTALMIDDWRLTDDAQIAENFGNLHDWSQGGRIGNWVTVNGEGTYVQEVARHARLRLRLINAANARIFSLEVRGLSGWVIALDGMPLETPRPLSDLALGPAQRADILVDVVAEEGEEAFLVSFERDGGYAIATFPVRGQARPTPRAEPAPLPPNPMAELTSVEDARRMTLNMEGGAMGGMQSALLNGEQTGIRDLAQAGKAWAFNGMADMPDAPLIEAARGETVRIEMVNDTAWPHAMHLHGHHFRQVHEDGSLGPWRDTILMARNESVEIAFVADNPGDWLLHCHMLEHSAAGMMTWLRVL
jgi:FtsP/CotA-like multicopper oxidase with cupredoxin domain